MFDCGLGCVLHNGPYRCSQIDHQRINLSHEPNIYEPPVHKLLRHRGCTDACELAERELVAEGDADAWASFRRHNLDGLEYAEIAQQLRITPAEARTRARRAAYRFERALRRLLSDEGVAESDLDEEIAWLMEVSAR